TVDGGKLCPLKPEVAETVRRKDTRVNPHPDIKPRLAHDAWLHGPRERQVRGRVTSPRSARRSRSHRRPPRWGAGVAAHTAASRHLAGGENDKHEAAAARNRGSEPKRCKRVLLTSEA